jgi:hypothetical protein
MTRFSTPPQEPNMTRTTHTFSTSSTTLRSLTMGLSLAVTLGVLGSMGQIASYQQRSIEVALASGQPTQVVVVTGQRAARA